MATVVVAAMTALVVYALHATQEAEHQRVEAVAAGARATAAANSATQAERRATETLSDTFLSNGVLSGREGGNGEPALWFANAAKLLPSDAERLRLNDIRVTMWGREAFVPVAALEQQAEYVEELRFHPSGRYLISRPMDSVYTIIWDVAAQRQLRLMEGFEKPTCAGWSDDGKLLALGSPQGEVCVAGFPDLADRRQFAVPTGVRPKYVAFSKDNRYLAATAGRSVVVWEISTGRIAGRANLNHNAGTVIFASDGRFATTCEDGCVIVFDIGDNGLRETLTGRHRFRPSGLGRRPAAPVFLNGGRSLATVLDDGRTLRFSDIDGKKSYDLPMGEEIWSLSLAPSGRLLAAAVGWSTALIDLDDPPRVRPVRATQVCGAIRRVRPH